MPLKGEHAARINSPSKYDEFRRVNDKFGSGIDVIFGIFTKGGKKISEIQTIRFDSSKFTPEQAKKWLKDHEFRPIEFEAAKEVSNNDVNEGCTPCEIFAKNSNEEETFELNDKLSFGSVDISITEQDGIEVAELTGIALAEGTWKGLFYPWQDLKESMSKMLRIHTLYEHEDGSKDKVKGFLSNVRWDDTVLGIRATVLIFDGWFVNKLKELKSGNPEFFKNKSLGFSVTVRCQATKQDGIWVGSNFEYDEISLTTSPACTICHIDGGIIRTLSENKGDREMSDEKKKEETSEEIVEEVKEEKLSETETKVTPEDDEQETKEQLSETDETPEETKESVEEKKEEEAKLSSTDCIKQAIEVAKTEGKPDSFIATLESTLNVTKGEPEDVKKPEEREEEMSEEVSKEEDVQETPDVTKEEKLSETPDAVELLRKEFESKLNDVTTSLSEKDSRIKELENALSTKEVDEVVESLLNNGVIPPTKAEDTKKLLLSMSDEDKPSFINILTAGQNDLFMEQSLNEDVKEDEETKEDGKFTVT